MSFYDFHVTLFQCMHICHISECVCFLLDSYFPLMAHSSISVLSGILKLRRGVVLSCTCRKLGLWSNLLI
ncbi:hypothetical protein AQUCO_02800219v1 [Aquilegia coerulea]|uniref:Uncharacterized protein n=1 Tax=Aquilegia coerulea TaxID=218851 RepID=A0A2G5D4F5_AQUCA|nr:hypothetical protein AQUCO_02800219v1 [Aquilegia coerulea]